MNWRRKIALFFTFLLLMQDFTVPVLASTGLTAGSRNFQRNAESDIRRLLGHLASCRSAEEVNTTLYSYHRQLSTELQGQATEYSSADSYIDDVIFQALLRYKDQRPDLFQRSDYATVLRNWELRAWGNMGSNVVTGIVSSFKGAGDSIYGFGSTISSGIGSGFDTVGKYMGFGRSATVKTLINMHEEITQHWNRVRAQVREIHGKVDMGLMQINSSYSTHKQNQQAFTAMSQSWMGAKDAVTRPDLITSWQENSSQFEAASRSVEEQHRALQGGLVSTELINIGARLASWENQVGTFLSSSHSLITRFETDRNIQEVQVQQLLTQARQIIQTVEPRIRSWDEHSSHITAQGGRLQESIRVETQTISILRTLNSQATQMLQELRARLGVIINRFQQKTTAWETEFKKVPTIPDLEALYAWLNQMKQKHQNFQRELQSSTTLDPNTASGCNAKLSNLSMLINVFETSLSEAKNVARSLQDVIVTISTFRTNAQEFRNIISNSTGRSVKEVDEIERASQELQERAQSIIQRLNSIDVRIFGQFSARSTEINKIIIEIQSSIVGPRPQPSGSTIPVGNKINNVKDPETKQPEPTPKSTPIPTPTPTLTPTPTPTSTSTSTSTSTLTPTPTPTPTSTLTPTSTQSVTQTETLWVSMRRFWEDSTTWGMEKANSGLAYSMENPGTVLAIAAILGVLVYSLYNYKAVARLIKTAAKKLGSFVYSCVYGVTSTTVSLVSQLLTLIGIDAIRRGMKPVHRNFCRGLAKWTKEKVPLKELKDTFTLLIVQHRPADTQQLVTALPKVIPPQYIKEVPPTQRQSGKVSVTVTGKSISPEKVRNITEIVNQKVEMQTRVNATTIIVPVKLPGKNQVTIESINTVEALPGVKLPPESSSIPQTQKPLDPEKEAIITIKLEAEPPKKVLDKPVTDMVATQLVTPAAPWYVLREFMETSGRSEDRVLMQKIKDLSGQYPTEYQARLAFLFGQYGWTGAFFNLYPVKGEEVSPHFLRFYRAMVHAYFPRHPDTLKPLDQERLRNVAKHLFDEYKSAAQPELKLQPLVNMKLMEVYLELGRCLVPNCPQYNACRGAMSYFDELMDSRYEQMQKASTPRLVFLGKKPVKMGDIHRCLKASESNLAIFAVNLRFLDPPKTPVLAKYSPSSKTATFVMNLFESYRQGPAYQNPCIMKGENSMPMEPDKTWEEVVGAKDIDSVTKEDLVRALIYLVFGIHPDDQPHANFHKLVLKDAININLAKYCNKRNRKPVAVAS